MGAGTHVRERLLGEARLIEVEGELDVSTAERFIDLLFAAVSRPRQRVIVDLERADFIDSTVLNALFTARRKLRAGGGNLAIVCTKAHLERVLEAAGVDAAYPIVKSRAAALERLAAAG